MRSFHRISGLRVRINVLRVNSWRFSIEQRLKSCSGQRRAPLEGNFTGSRATDPLPCYFTWISRWKRSGTSGRTWVAFRQVTQTNSQWLVHNRVTSPLRSRKSNFSSFEHASSCGSSSDTFFSSQLLRKDEINAEKVWFWNPPPFLCLPLMWKKIQFPPKPFCFPSLAEYSMKRNWE